MSGQAAIDRNIEALKRILAMLVSMTGFSGATPDLRAAASVGTLPRRLHLAVLCILRPAEAAARRLIIALALTARARKDICPPPRASKTGNPAKLPPHTLASRSAARRSLGLAVVLSPADIARAEAARRSAARRAGRPPRLALPLFDPLRDPFRQRGKYVPPHAAPRIWALGADWHRLPPPPSPNDKVDATRLGLRLAALGRALDDMPAQARRFARWQARRDAALAPGAVSNARNGARRVRFRRATPLRPGRPPGCRLSGYDPDHAPRRNVREVDEVLAHAHALARFAMERPRDPPNF